MMQNLFPFSVLPMAIKSESALTVRPMGCEGATWCSKFTISWIVEGERLTESEVGKQGKGNGIYL